MNPSGGDIVQLHFYGPTSGGVSSVTTTWNSTDNTGSSTRCFSDDVSTAQWLTPSGFGQWQIRVFVNSNAIGSPYTFQLSNASPIEPRGPNYTGSFDAVDCAHIYGWAEDQNSPTTTISVDISIDGSFWATLAAGDSRSDLTSLGIGNHAWNEYSLPANLHDGNQHSVRVVYSGTPTDLPGSPKTFENACGATVSSSIRVGHVVTLPSNPNGTVYYVATSGLYPFATAATFYSWGFQFSDVLTANSAEAALPIQTIIIPTKISGCSDPISQINGTCGSTPLTVTWVSGSTPPANMASGQSYQVKWQVAGPAQIQSRLCYGSSSDPATICQQFATYWQNSGTNTSGTYGDTVLAPTVNGQQTLYVVAQAQANGQTVYTTPIQATVSGLSTSRQEFHVYSASRSVASVPNPLLDRMLAILEKTNKGGSLFQYRLYVLTGIDTPGHFLSMSCGMVRPESMNVVPSSLNVELANINDGVAAMDFYSNILAGTDSGWENATVLEPLLDAQSKSGSLIFDTAITLGSLFVPASYAVGVGAATATAQILRDAADRVSSETSLTPSSAFNSRLQALNDYDTVVLTVGGLPEFNTSYIAGRFTFIVDESSGSVPWFYISATPTNSSLTSIELQDNRSTLRVCRVNDGCQ
jgi:hypothetical protein